jgi:hypothetical protein
MNQNHIILMEVDITKRVDTEFVLPPHYTLEVQNAGTSQTGTF